MAHNSYEQVRGDTPSLEEHLVCKIHAILTEINTPHEPVCKRCQDLGVPSEALLLEDEASVYVSTYWEERNGWTLFGLYHTTHDLSSIAGSNPPKPVATLQGVLRRTDHDIPSPDETDRFTLDDLVLVDVAFPDTLPL